MGLDPYGISVHVGSQQTDLGQWDKAVAQVAQMFSVLQEADVDLRMVNLGGGFPARRSEEHTSELQSLMRISYAVFCLKKKNTTDSRTQTDHNNHQTKQKTRKCINRTHVQN